MLGLHHKEVTMSALESLGVGVLALFAVWVFMQLRYDQPMLMLGGKSPRERDEELDRRFDQILGRDSERNE